MRCVFNIPAFLLRLSLLTLLLPGVSWAVAAESPDLPEPVVQVNELNGKLVLNISYRVPVSPREAWAVLTDFENMPAFVPGLESSKVLMRTGKTIQVEQTGSVRFGMLPIQYASRRQIEIVPYQSISSHTLSGNARLDSIMLLTPSGSGTLLTYHATAVPDLPVPNSLISSSLGEMLENQFKAMGQEMARRAQLNDAMQIAAQTSPPTVSKAIAVKPAVRQTSPVVKKARAQAKKRPG